MLKLVASVALVLPLLLGGCMTSDAYDEIHDLKSQAAGGLVTAADAPAGFVGSAWAAPHEQKAEDISLADLPQFAFSATDPWNVLPPPFGTFYVPWKVLLTVASVIPGVTDSQVVKDLDSHAIPAREPVAANHVPSPGFGSFGTYWKRRAASHMANMRHAGYTMKYIFLNANSDLPPYDSFFPDSLERDKTTVHYTFDAFLFNYDWDDPYID